MIYLITGVPGSGKTLYAVSTLVQDLMKQSIVKRGKVIERRLVVDNIKDLLLPHEMLDPGQEDDFGVLKPGEGHGVSNWYEWCKPADLIVIDEVQRWWRPRGTGTKVPKDVAALETHRHMGVDFVIITQSPMLLDQNVRRLVGRHLHVRRLFGMQRAVVYNWDGCNVNPQNAKSATMTFFNYPRSAYALYKSSELHTKQKQRVPLWMAVPLVAALAGVFVIPAAFATLSGVMGGKGIQSSAKKPDDHPKSVDMGAGLPPALPGTITAAKPWKPQPTEEVVEPSNRVDVSVASQKPMGCIAMADRCTCYDQSGSVVKMPIEACQEGSRTTGFVLPAGATVVAESPKNGVALASRY